MDAMHLMLQIFQNILSFIQFYTVKNYIQK
jgi:hypothetical protein